MKLTFRKALFFIILIFSTQTAFCKKKPVSPLTTEKEKKNHAASMLNHNALIEYVKNENAELEAYLESLSKEQQISQVFLVNLQGNVIFVPVEKREEPLIPGGYIFFSYNIAETPEQIISFTDNIRKYCSKNNCVQPYLSIDQEGGVVNRLRSITSTFPSSKRITQNISSEKAFELYALQAKQMKLLGFDMNLAPVAEIATEKNSEFLDTRSFGSSENVLAYGTAFLNAFEQNGIATVLKHFPGNTNSDPHTGLPEIDAEKEILEQNFIFPFEKLVKEKPSAVLMSHARTTVYDCNTPACLSHYWVTERLIDSMNYKGLVISDDIFMAALEKNGFPPEEAVTKAIEAGIDVIMLSEKRFGDVADILLEKAENDAVFAEKLKTAELKVLRYKKRAGIISTNTFDNQNNFADQNKINSTIEQFEKVKEQGELFYANIF